MTREAIIFSNSDLDMAINSTYQSISLVLPCHLSATNQLNEHLL